MEKMKLQSLVPETEVDENAIMFQAKKTSQNTENELEQAKLTNTHKSMENDDDKIVFLLENNLLSQIGLLEETGYDLKLEHKQQYYTKLYESVIKEPDSTIREYLKQGIELPDKFLAISYMVQIQKNQDKDSFGVTKFISSFINKVKKGLQTDPLMKYKLSKENDPHFVNELFDLWCETSFRHFEDIQKHVLNKKKFLWFYYKKSKSIMIKDIHKFTENVLQKHIIDSRAYFQIPMSNDFFIKHLDINKISRMKEVLQKHDEVHAQFESYNVFRITMNSWRNHVKVSEIELQDVLSKILENTIKKYYETHPEVGESIKEISPERQLKKTVTSKLVKDIDKKLLNELPLEALKVIESIKEISEHLYAKDINHETKEMIEFLWKEKLPEVISKYVNIDSNYRESLKNIQGKNAQQLMIESLTIIKDSLACIEKDINEENLKDLSIHTRYLRNSFKI